MARLHQAGQRLEHLQEAPDDHGTERIKTLEAANRKLTQAVAERRDAEQELLHYKYLLGALRDGFYFVDTDYIYREVNERYLDFVGKRREQLLGKRINEVLEEDFFQRQIKPLFDHCAVEGGLHTQQWVEYPGTDRRYLDVRCNPAYDEAHGLVGYIVLARDITDLKRMEERLRMYESILAQVSERISVIGTDYHYRFVNQRNWDFYGKHPEELVGRHLSDLIGGETFQMRTKAYLDQCFQGAMVNYQAPMPAKGVMRDFDVNMAPYRETDGSIAGAVVTIRDITERKRIEQALATERNLLRSLIDNIPDYIFAKDKDSRYIVKNLAGARLLGAAHPDEVIGKSDLDYYPAEFAVQYRADDQFVIQRGEALVAKEEINANPGGDRKLWVLTTKVPLRDAAGNITGLVGMTRDITEQKQIAIALKHSEERFRDFAETAADWFWEMGLHLSVTYISERYQELTGETCEQLLGRSYLDAYAAHIPNLEQRSQFCAALQARQPFDDIEMEYFNTGNGVRYFVLSGKPFYDSEGGFAGYRGAGRDVTHAKQMADQLGYQANHDDLTGLVNRRRFEHCLEQSLAQVKAGKASDVLCYVDLDQFKIVNDTAGHLAGDQLLKDVADLIADKMRTSDVVARLGGDEFGLLLHNCPIEHAQYVAERLLADLQELRFAWHGKVFEIGASMGLVPLTPEDVNIGELLSKADIACYTAKDLGRNRVHIYRQEDDELRRRHADMLHVANIRGALQNDRFCLYAQPIVSLTAPDAKPAHFEVLLRMRNEDGTLLAPGAFIPAAERYGLMGAIDRWVIRETLCCFDEFFDHDPNLIVAINLSGNSLNDASLLEFVRRQLAETAVAPQRLCFEITETAVISNLTQAIQFVSEMKKLGCRFALDDFGSGLSSFAYLKRFPVDYLKIDGGFIKDLCSDRIDYAMVAAINQVGHILGISTIAEFVEHPEIIDILRQLGVDYAQGYAVGRPTPLSC